MTLLHFVVLTLWRVTHSCDAPLLVFRSRREQSTSSHGQARYILSTQQEEEIRDAFLKDRLDGFTMVRVILALYRLFVP